MRKVHELKAKVLHALPKVETYDVLTPSSGRDDAATALLHYAVERKLSASQYLALEEVLRGTKESCLKAIFYLERYIRNMEDSK